MVGTYSGSGTSGAWLDQSGFACDGVAADIWQPGVAEGARQRAQAPRLCPPGNFGSGYAGLRNMGARPRVFATLFRCYLRSFPAETNGLARVGWRIADGEVG